MSTIRSVFTLISGTVGSQLILVAVSPILTRLYKPEDFAVLAVFMALTQVAEVIASGRYELAILLPRDLTDAFKIGILCVALAAMVSLVILAGVVVWREAASAFWGMPSLARWLWLLPVAVFFSAVFAMGQAANIRLGAYRAVAGANVVKTLVMSVVQLGLGLLVPGPGSLVVGSTMANGAANSRLLRSVITANGGVPAWRWSELGSLALQYRRFPAFSMPAGLVNVGNVNLMNLTLPVLMGPATLGFYSLGMRMLGAPLQQIAGPIGQVFMRSAAEELRQTGTARRSFLNGLAALSTISITFFGILYLVIEDVFTFVFGPGWVVAGQFAAIMMPLFAVRFIVSPLSGIASLTDNRHSLAVNIALLLVSGLVLLSAASSDWAAEQLLIWLSLSQSAVYLAYLPALYWLAAHKGQRE